MTDLRKAAKMAFDLLCDAVEPTATQVQADIGMCAQWDVDAIECIEILRQALAHCEQEPVAWMFVDDEDNNHKTFHGSPPRPEQVAYLAKWNRPAWQPLYTAPPKRVWQELTDEDWHNLPSSNKKGCERDAEIFNWIEDKLKEKNT